MSTIPYVIEQTSRGERSYDIFSRLLSDRIVFFRGRSKRYVSQSDYCSNVVFRSTRPRKDIQLYINSPEVLYQPVLLFMIQCNI